MPSLRSHLIIYQTVDITSENVTGAENDSLSPFYLPTFHLLGRSLTPLALNLSLFTLTKDLIPRVL